MVPIFKPGDREKMHRYMGIVDGLAAPLALPEIEGIQFHPGSSARQNDNVEFDKKKFAAYADAVKLAQMLLLQETNPLGGPPTAGSGQLSALMSNALTKLLTEENGGVLTTYNYDWTKLNQLGNHGGNVFTTTLQKPPGVVAFDPSAPGTISAGTIFLGPSHGLSTGAAVQYDTGFGALGEENEIIGLKDDAGYFVGLVGTDRIRLFRTPEEAHAGVNPIALAPAAQPSTALDRFTTVVIVDVASAQLNLLGLDTFRVPRLSDARPWLRMIDGDRGWRADSRTTTTNMFVVHAPGTGPDFVEWKLENLASGEYDVQATWLWNVTQRLDDPTDETDGDGNIVPPIENHFGTPIDLQNEDDHLRPTTTAIYEIFDGAVSRGIFTRDQTKFTSQFEDAALGLAFDRLAKVQVNSGILRVVLRESSTGYVSAGPIRVVDATGVVRHVKRELDPETLVENLASGFTISQADHEEIDGFDVGWVGLFYDAGSGNFPMYESERLRPVFRSYFVDWQNNGLQFPDLGDTTSPDPNDTTVAITATPGPYVTPFSPPTLAPPTGLALTIDGAETRTFTGTTLIASITGNGDATPDMLTITATSISTSVATLAVDVVTNSFTRTIGSFSADGFVLGQEIVARGFGLNNGVYHITNVGTLALEVDEVLLFGDDTGSGDETLISLGKVVFTGDVGGGGFVGLVVNADVVEVLPGVTVSTRTITGADARTAASTGDSGSVAFVAERILLDRGAAIVAHADSGFTGGDITLTANSLRPTRFDFLRIEGSDALVQIGPSAVVHGENVSVNATATAGTPVQLGDAVNDIYAVLPAGVGLFAAMNTILTRLDSLPLPLPAAIRSRITTITTALTLAESALRALMETEGVFDLPAGVASNGVFSKSDARVDADSGARLIADGDVSLVANASSTLSVTTLSTGGYLGLSYAKAQPTALARVSSGAVIDAGDDVTVSAVTAVTLTLRTEVSNAGDVVGVSASFAKSHAHSRAEVEVGATIHANDLTVAADTSRAVSNIGIAGNFGTSGTAGLGAVLAASFFVSIAEAVLAGLVTATGDVLVDARSRELSNQTRAFGSVATGPGGSGLVDAVRELLGSIGLSVSVGGRTLDPANGGDASTPSLDLTIGAALALAETDNRASAWVDDGAVLDVGGNVDVTSLAESRPRASASAGAVATLGVDVGGAIASAKIANQASSYIGYNAVVDVAHGLRLDANARVVDGTPLFDPLINLTDPDLLTGTARVAEEFADANFVGNSVGIALSPLLATLLGILTNPSGPAASYSHAGTGGAAPSAIAGGASFIEIYNMGASGVAVGALVNDWATTTPAADQDVVLDADAFVHVANIAGLASALSLNIGPGTTPGEIGVGGYINTLIVDNYARAHVDDRSVVRASRDIVLDALVRTEALNVTQAGSDSRSIAVDGGFGFVMLGHEALAGIEERATVQAGRNMDLHAADEAVVVNSAGATGSGTATAFGFGVALTLMGQPRPLHDLRP